MATEIESVRGFLAARQADADPNASIEAMRAGYDEAGQAMPIAEGVETRAITLGGVPGEQLTPQGAGDAAILYFHGGGYMTGGTISHRALCSHIAAAAGAVIWSMDYRLAPEAPFPAAVDDGLAAYRGLLDKGTAADKIVIMGDSAGGGLTVATALAAREAGLPSRRALRRSRPGSISKIPAGATPRRRRATPW